MTACYPKRLTRYYATHLLWLVEYGTSSDLAMVPPSVRAWVREVRACVSMTTPTTVPAPCNLLTMLMRERNPLL